MESTDNTNNKDNGNEQNDLQKKLLDKSIIKILSEQKRRNTFFSKNTTIPLIVILPLVFGGGYMFTNYYPDEHPQDSLKTGFVIQNLRGDTVKTWASWKILGGDTFHVHVVDSVYATKERQDAILDAIMSTKKLQIDDSLLHKGPEGSTSTYYTGWAGALNSINDTTKLPIPKNLHFHVTDNGEGDILIDLTNLSHPDGISGYTTAVIDEQEHQILKAKITIYNIEKLSIPQLETIVLHELGHGFGLAHSSAPEDLMAPEITTAYPYISECDLDAIKLLYDGGESSSVTCEK